MQSRQHENLRPRLRSQRSLLLHLAAAAPDASARVRRVAQWVELTMNLNRGVPNVYSPLELQDWPTGEAHLRGYRPSRPIPFQGWSWRKFIIAWRVFTGRYDALDWEKQMEANPAMRVWEGHHPLPCDPPASREDRHHRALGQRLDAGHPIPNSPMTMEKLINMTDDERLGRTT